MINITNLYTTLGLVAEELTVLHQQIAAARVATQALDLPALERALGLPPSAAAETPAPEEPVPAAPTLTYEQRREKFLAELSLNGGRLPVNFFSLSGDTGRLYTAAEAEKWMGLAPGTLSPV